MTGRGNNGIGGVEGHAHGRWHVNVTKPLQPEKVRRNGSSSVIGQRRLMTQGSRGSERRESHP